MKVWSGIKHTPDLHPDPKPPILISSYIIARLEDILTFVWQIFSIQGKV